MLRYWPIATFLVAILCGFSAPVLVAAAMHWWGLPLSTWLPGASVLFLPPYAATLLASALLARRAWRGSTLPTNLLAIVAGLCGTFVGLLLAILPICSIARECL